MPIKRVQVTFRSGEKERGVARLRKSDTAIIFTTSTGKRFEVDLVETADGNVLLRSHNGPLSVAQYDGTLEVTTREA